MSDKQETTTETTSVVAEKVEHDVDYTDPEEKKAEHVSLILNHSSGRTPISEEKQWGRARRVYLPSEMQALQNPRRTVERARHWELQAPAQQGDQQDPLCDAPGEDP